MEASASGTYTFVTLMDQDIKFCDYLVSLIFAFIQVAPISNLPVNKGDLSVTEVIKIRELWEFRKDDLSR